MQFFVKENSIVRKIWGESEIILFIFAGSAAEFALHKSVDWLYFTGRLPADPVGRMFSTVSYARRIIFSNKESALKTIDGITKIHEQLEINRGFKIPAEAYLDVLSMLIDYSIRAYELLRKRLSEEEKDEVFDVFYRFGNRMQLSGLPETFQGWQKMRERQLNSNYALSSFSTDLFAQYRRQLGSLRYRILLEAQKMMVPRQISSLLKWEKKSAIRWAIPLYKGSRIIHLDRIIKSILLPSQYKAQVDAMDVNR